MIRAHEGLHEACAGDVLLEHVVHDVEPLLHEPEERLHADHEERDEQRRDEQERQDRQREAPARRDHQDEAAEHEERRAGPDAKGDLRQSLDGAHVAREPDQQLPGPLPVEVSEGVALDPDEERLAQVASNALADAHREDVVGDRDDRAHRGDAEHRQRRLHDDGAVVLRNALVDDALHEPRDGEVERDQRRQHDEREHGEAPVGLHEAEESP